MQKTFTYRPYTVATRENGKATPNHIYAVDFRQTASEKREQIEKCLAEQTTASGAVMFFKEDTTRSLFSELRYMDEATWNEHSHVLEENESKLGLVTRSCAKGYSVNVVMVDEDFNEYIKTLTGLKEEETTEEYLASKFSFFCRIEGEPAKNEGIRGMSEKDFYKYSNPVSDKVEVFRD